MSNHPRATLVFGLHLEQHPQDAEGHDLDLWKDATFDVEPVGSYEWSDDSGVILAVRASVIRTEDWGCLKVDPGQMQVRNEWAGQLAAFCEEHGLTPTGEPGWSS
jgi:hypothetical protein